MPDTVRNGCRLHWEIHGSGPPLVLAAGLGGTATFWHANIPALSKHFTVLAFDQRGTGRSSRVEVESVEEMSADLIAILDAAGVQRAAYLGHSTGGAIGVATALDYPDRLSSLVIYASTTCGDTYRRRIFDLRLDLLSHLGALTYAKYTTLLLYPPYWINANDEKLRELELLTSKQLGDAKVQGSRLDAILKFDRRSDLSGLNLPTLVLCCEDDILTPSYFSREYANLIPNAKLLLVPRGGHAYAQTEPDEFNETMLKFFLSQRH
jgi:aminoacrylate hydrolase